MGRDELVVAALVASFAALATAHLALVVGLAGRQPRWRSLAALAFAPLAPYWGWREGMRARAGLWIGCALVYGVARALAAR